MSLEMVVRLFAKKRGFTLKETPDGFEIRGEYREWLSYSRPNGIEMVLCGKSFALTNKDESTIYVVYSGKEQEMQVSVKFGCLPDYISQLSPAKNKVLVDLKQRLESRLGQKEKAENWTEEGFSKFNKFAVYRLLQHFYP